MISLTEEDVVEKNNKSTNLKTGQRNSKRIKTQEDNKNAKVILD